MAGFVIYDFEGHMRSWTNGAFVRAVARFAALVAYRGFHSRAVVSAVALRFERALAISALVFRTPDARSTFVVVLPHSLHSV